MLYNFPLMLRIDVSPSFHMMFIVAKHVEQWIKMLDLLLNNCWFEAAKFISMCPLEFTYLFLLSTQGLAFRRYLLGQVGPTY